jgi:hypothetical protein
MITKEQYDKLDGIPKFSLWKTAVCHENGLSNDDGLITLKLIAAYRTVTEQEAWEMVEFHATEVGYSPDAIAKYYQTIPAIHNN